MSSAPYGSVNPTPHKQAKNRRRALIVRRHRAMQQAEISHAHGVDDEHRSDSPD